MWACLRGSGGRYVTRTSFFRVVWLQAVDTRCESADVLSHRLHETPYLSLLLRGDSLALQSPPPHPPQRVHDPPLVPRQNRQSHPNRRATRDTDALYPDATPEEVERTGDRTCIVCREEMVARETARENGERTAGDGGPNETPKRLACGHVFHFHCLRSWLERQQSCPTWRVRYFCVYTLNADNQIADEMFFVHRLLQADRQTPGSLQGFRRSQSRLSSARAVPR